MNNKSIHIIQNHYTLEPVGDYAICEYIKIDAYLCKEDEMKGKKTHNICTFVVNSVSDSESEQKTNYYFIKYILHTRCDARVWVWLFTFAEFVYIPIAAATHIDYRERLNSEIARERSPTYILAWAYMYYEYTRRDTTYACLRDQTHNARNRIDKAPPPKLCMWWEFCTALFQGHRIDTVSFVFMPSHISESRNKHTTHTHSHVRWSK